MKRLLALLAVVALALSAPPARAASTTFVISQFQVAGATAADEFVEIHNVSATAQDLNGHRVVYRSAAGTTDVAIVNWTTSTVVPAGGFYLVGASPGYDGGGADITYLDGGSGRFAGAGGGLAIRLGAVNTGTVIDSVGFGTATNAFVEGAVTAAPAANNSQARGASGCTDTDSNSSDFALASPATPRNSASAASTCSGGDSAPGVSSTAPSNGATGVAISTNLSVTFSEPVNVAGSWFTIACGVSGSHTAAVSGGPTTFTLDPGADFVNGETCTVTVLASQVTDQDVIDPPDSMAANYTFSFSTISTPANLLFSEYVEGSSNNKGVEIFNATANPVNLSDYRVEIYFNGSSTIGNTIVLSGTLQAGDVFVLAHTSATFPADQLSGSMTFNGDDALVLRHGAAPLGTIVDSIGQVGFDPGSEWGTDPISTQDNTIRRLPTVCSGDSNPTDTFDPAVEWEGFPIDTFIGLGSHPHSCPGVPTPPEAAGSAAPDYGLPSTTTTLTVTVTPGALPTSTGITVQCNLTPLGGSASQALTEGTPNVFSFLATVAPATPPGRKTVTCTATDAQSRSGVTSLFFTVTVSPQTPIHDIQGSGASTPLPASTVVTTEGIVTGRKSNGFFLQTAVGEDDGDPATSEGIFVFTSSLPPANAAVGNRVSVTGTVQEFVPSTDPSQPPVTEIGFNPGVGFVSAGNPLPAPIALTTTFPDPAGVLDQLERLEGMRVSVASLTVVAPTDGSVDETNATAFSNGVFAGVVTGVPVPFREPGIQYPDPLPSGAPAGCSAPSSTVPPPTGCVPRFDANPEILGVDSDAIGATQLNLSTGAVLTGLVGPLDYGFRLYTILPDPASPPVLASPGITATPASAPTAAQVTVAGFNMERFFDTVNDPSISEPVLTAAAFANRLTKASAVIRDYLRTPDVLAVMEMENLSTLQSLAAQISADAVANSQPDPQYAAYLEEGNDVGGIDVGFLVKGGGRVSVNSVTQFGKTGVPYIDPSTGQCYGFPTCLELNDRPPLVLDATVNRALDSFPLVVIVNHLRSLNGVDDLVDPRVRIKRATQAEYLADLIQQRQVANPAEHMVVLGDFNAFEFNDGYVDSMGTIQGTPTAATEVVTASPDLVNPNLTNLGTTPPPAQQYSYVFGGSHQTLDHLLVNAGMLADANAYIEHARIDADFPESLRAGSGPERLSDHDPVLAFITPHDADGDGVWDGVDNCVNAANPGQGDLDFDGIGDACDDNVPPVAIVTFPNGGENLVVNQPATVTWTASDNVAISSILVDYSPDNGATWNPICSFAGPASSCSFTPTALTVQGRIRLRVQDTALTTPNETTDLSNLTFKVTAPAVTLTRPTASGLVWKAGTVQSIAWSHALGAGSLMNIELSRDNGGNWAPIATNVVNAATVGTYNWTVTAPLTTQARIRVSWAGNPAVSSTNPWPITITSRVQVTAPNTAIGLRVGSTVNVIWTHNYGSGRFFDVRLDRNGDQVCEELLAAGVPGTGTGGTYSWVVSGPTSAASRVCVTNTADALGTDISDVPFSITRVTVAAVGTSQSHTTKAIKWTHDYGAGHTFEIALDRDGDQVCEEVLASGVAGTATAGTYNWSVTGPSGATTRACVRESADSVAGLSAAFTINRITVTAPNTAVSWTIGTLQTITWTHDYGVAHTYAIGIDRDGNSVCEESIATGLTAGATSGSYAWTVSGPATNTARICVTEESDPSGADVSNVNFKIVP